MNYKNKIITSSFLILSVLAIIAGFTYTPSYISILAGQADSFSKLTTYKIYVIDFSLIFFGLALFIFSFIKITAHDYSKICADKITGFFTSLKLFTRDDSPHTQHFILFGASFVFITLIAGLATVIGSWETADGWEYLWVAQNIEQGHGFSYTSCNRWIAGIIDYPECTKHLQLTAYIEPGYSYFMAFLTKLLGRYGRLVTLLFQLVALFSTSVFIFLIGRRVFNPATGMTAAVTLSVLPFVNRLTWEYTPAVFAGLLISLSIYLFFWCLDNISVRRGLVLGFMMGFGCWMYSPVMTYIPLTIFFVLISKLPFRSVQFRTALVILVTAVTVMSPWSIRNLLLFDHFIPMRSGFGTMIYEHIPILAATFSSDADACADKYGPLWKVRNASEAVRTVRNDHDKYTVLKYRALNCIEETAPAEFKDYNEVEIDNFKQQKTFEFILAQPKIFLSLAIHKIKAFFVWGKPRTLISLLFVLGALATLRSQKSRILVVFVCAYVFTYLFVVPLYFRYGYPIQPIILIFASYIPVLAVSKLVDFYRSRS